MDYMQEVNRIISLDDSKRYKIELLQKLICDAIKLLESRDVSMQSSEKYTILKSSRLAQDNIRKLRGL